MINKKINKSEQELSELKHSKLQLEVVYLYENFAKIIYKDEITRDEKRELKELCERLYRARNL